MKLLITFFIWVAFIQVTYCQPILDLTEKSNKIEMPNGEIVIAFDISNSSVHKMKGNHKNIKLEIPTLEGALTIILKASEIFQSGFQIVEKKRNSEQKIDNYSLGYFYKGHVDGISTSSVSLNINENKISGLISANDKVYNIGFNKNVKSHIVVEHESIKDVSNFSCEQKGETSNRGDFEVLLTRSSSNCNNAVGIYYECDFDMFANFNYNSVDVANYISNTFNEVSNIYSAEGIPVLISQITVWIEDDPYTDNSTGIYGFADSLIQNSFPGDVAQLLTNDPGQNGGTAYVDQLCGNLPFGYCDIVNSHEVFPTYSWDVQVMAHELGHTFGSQHTHDCAWGPNGNSQIDDCGNVANGGGDSCYDSSNPIIPSNGGTIMSYCHTDPVGIDFLNGFGSEPGNLIRIKHQTCFCDNPVCSSASVIDGNDSYYTHPSDGNGASTSNASHADWFLLIPEQDGKISLSSCGEGVDTRVWIWEGSCEVLNFVALSDDDCESGNGSSYASEIIDLPVEAGKSYYIEWDNRWSNNAFNWNFVIDYTTNCDDTYITSNGMISDTILHAEMIIDATNQILNNANVIFKAGESIELKPGFEMSLGSSLELSIEGCDN